MSTKSSIEWTESTWNPVTGCTKISAGCANCYAERMARRLQHMGQPNYRRGFEVTLHPHMLEKPLAWKQPQLIFVNSMSDLFHEDVPADYILRVFDVMRRADWHQFQILTKRSGRLAELSPAIDWPDNVWMGVTVESSGELHRLDDLGQSGAAVRFVSFEPLLTSVAGADLTLVDWAVVGGESGPGARPMQASWVREIQQMCLLTGTAFFFKQWGGKNKKAAGRILDGRTWDAMPETVVVQ